MINVECSAVSAIKQQTAEHSTLIIMHSTLIKFLISFEYQMEWHLCEP